MSRLYQNASVVSTGFREEFRFLLFATHCHQKDDVISICNNDVTVFSGGSRDTQDNDVLMRHDKHEEAGEEYDDSLVQGARGSLPLEGVAEGSNSGVRREGANSGRESQDSHTGKDVVTLPFNSIMTMVTMSDHKVFSLFS